jgi:hypothetical protein
LGSLAGSGWNANQMMAIRALNLPAGKLLINLQVLAAMRTGEFEIAHWMRVLIGFLFVATIVA